MLCFSPKKSGGIKRKRQCGVEVGSILHRNGKFKDHRQEEAGPSVGQAVDSQTEGCRGGRRRGQEGQWAVTMWATGRCLPFNQRWEDFEGLMGCEMVAQRAECSGGPEEATSAPRAARAGFTSLGYEEIRQEQTQAAIASPVSPPGIRIQDVLLLFITAGAL